MKIQQDDDGWSVLNGDRPVAINGTVSYAERDELVTEIESRGLFVWSDGTLAKEAEPVSENVDGGAPATEDPPVDPGAQPEDPDPNPTVPQAPSDEDEIRPFKDDSIVVSVEDEQAAYEEFIEKNPIPKVKKPRAPRKPKAEPADEERFTPEQKAARAEYAKKYRKQMTDEQKEKARERARERQKKWRENHPDKAAEYAKQSSERRKERYNEDEEFRAAYRAKQKAYATAGKPAEDVDA
jgi:hypothetical protein